MLDDLPQQEMRRLRDAIRAEKTKQDKTVLACETSLAEFTKHFWHVVEPGRPLIEGWPFYAICQHLEAIERGEFTRAIFNVPPGFMKSLLTNVFFPAWVWGPRKKPSMRFIGASYAEALTIRDNLRFRRIIMDDEYRQFWGHVFGPSGDTFAKERVGNDKTGWKLATSIKGLGTGERADIWICDDLNNVQTAESLPVMESLDHWIREVLPDRLNDQDKSIIINIQQRTHEKDASGTMLELWEDHPKFVHLMIPFEYEPARHCTTQIGWTDPRFEDGEFAWPERFSVDAVALLKREKGPYAWAGQYQQSPAPRGGGIVKRDWWKVWPSAEFEECEEHGTLGKAGYRPMRFPDWELVIVSVDTAYTEREENDWCACTVWGLFRTKANNPKIMLMWAWKERFEMHDLVQKIIFTTRHPNGNPNNTIAADVCLIEAKANGLSVIQEIKRLTRDGECMILGIDPDGDKVARMHSVVPMFADGLVYAPERRYADMVIDDVGRFPKGESRDIADTVSMALRWLRRKGFAKFEGEVLEERVEEMESMIKGAVANRHPSLHYDI